MRRWRLALAAGAGLGLAAAAGFRQEGYAVYYTGKPDRETAMTAAHRTLPFGSWVKVTHKRTNRSVTVKVNDRGPWNSASRIIDLSTGAARALGVIEEGVAPVVVESASR